MRLYSKLHHELWTGPLGRALRTAGPNVQVLAIYLLSAPSSNMIGLYYLPLPTLCHETGLDEQAANAALAALSKMGFAYYDADTETVWVPDMARSQIADELKPNDNQIVGVRKELEKYRTTKFVRPFLEKYGVAFKLFDATRQGPMKGLARGSEGASKGLPSQEQNQQQQHEQDQDQDQDQPHASVAGVDEGEDEDEANVLNAQSEAFRQAWAEWRVHRRQKKKSLTPLAASRQLKTLVSWGEQRAIAAIGYSVEQGYTGIYEDNRHASQQPRRADRHAGQFQESLAL